MHHKVLVCDRKFIVTTSFNWLSFRGDPTMSFRQEVGCVVEGNKVVEELAAPRIENNQRNSSEHYLSSRTEVS